MSDVIYSTLNSNEIVFIIPYLSVCKYKRRHASNALA